MIYPSLLYLNENDSRNPCAETAYEVFDDIKLTALLSDEAINAVLRVCGREDIYGRREIFSCARDEHFFECLNELYKKICVVSEYADAYDAARTGEEKRIIYVSLCRTSLEFYRSAADMPSDGVFIDRFRNFFVSELKKPSVGELEKRCQQLMPEIEKVRAGENMFKIRGETVKLSRGHHKTYVETISECAENLGLKPVEFSSTGGSVISNNLICGIAQLYPDEFNEFNKFYSDFKDFYCSGILRYKSEIRFYLEFISVFEKVRKAGIPLNYAEIADENEERSINFKNAYDITLLTKDEMKIIPNDASFTPDFPFFYLTGANGGGKTTYLRTVGVSILMFMCGAPSPCDSGRLSIPHNVYTHFPRDERFDRMGRFADEQNRVDYILNNADQNSVVLLNETYSTTGEENAVKLTSALAERLYGMGVFGIYITHQHGISQSDIPYLNVVVDRDDSNRRTYKVERRRDNQGSFAHDVLEKYSLTKEALKIRFEKLKR